MLIFWLLGAACKYLLLEKRDGRSGKKPHHLTVENEPNTTVGNVVHLTEIDR